MNRILSFIVAVMVVVIGSGQAMADPMSDDFDTDTSANWTGYQGASHTVDSGDNNLMQVSNDGVNWNPYVVHNTANLDVGETVCVDVQSSVADANVYSMELMAGYSAANMQTASDYAIRWIRFDSGFRCAQQNPGWGFTDYADPDTSGFKTLWIDRTGANDYEYLYGPVGSRTLVHSFTLGGTPPAGGLLVACCMGPAAVGTVTDGDFDNFAIMTIDAANGVVSATPGTLIYGK